MIQDSVLYTDGHGVKVTPRQFIVNNIEYFLDGITDVKFLTIRPSKIPAVLILLLGLAAIVTGALKLWPYDLFQPLVIGSLLLTVNMVIIYAGILLLLIGVIWLAAVHDKYAVRIRTAEGEKNAIVSTKRDYIAKIFDAIEEALTMKFF